jgi:phage protein D
MLLDFLSDKHREPAECVIRIDGDEIAHLYRYLVEVRVDCSRREASAGTLRFESRRDENGVWSVQDDPLIRPWKPIVIEAVFGSTHEEIVRGYIREVRADYPDDPGTTTVNVEMQDGSLEMDREHVRKAWGNEAPTTDFDIVSEIVSKYSGISADPENGSGLDGLVLNQNATDIRFLRARAEANGYELILDQGVLYFGPMRLEAEAQGTILVYAGRDTNCFRFDVRADGHQPDAVAYDVAPAESGSDPVQQVVQPDAELLGTESADSSNSGLTPFVWRVDRPGSVSQNELDAYALGRANEQAMRLHGQGELDGSLYGHVLRVGFPVGVDGVGTTLGGIYYVDAVTHSFSVDGYRQTFTLLRNAYGDNLEAGQSVLAGVL